MSRNLPLAAAVLAAMLLLGVVAQAQTQPSTQPASADYLKLLPSASGNGWLARQFSQFSSYPVIDKAVRLANQGHMAGARNMLQTLLKDHPENLRAHFMLGVLMNADADYAGTVEQMDAVLKALPDFGPAHLYRGLAEAELKRNPKAALADLTAAIESKQVSKKDHATAVDIFIQTAIDAKQYEQALQELERQPDKETYRHQRLRGLVLDGMGRYDQALAAFKHAAKLATSKNERLDVQKFAAESARKAGKYDEASAILLDALQSAPGDATIMRQLAWVEISAGHRNAAWDWIMLALDSHPDLDTRIYLINLLVQAKDPQGALKLIDRQLASVKGPKVRRKLLDTKFNVLIGQKDYAAALDLLDSEIAEAAKAGNETLRRQLVETKFNLLVEQKDDKAAFALLDKELSTASDTAYLVVLLQKKANLDTQLGNYIQAGLAYKELLGYINDPSVIISLATSLQLGGELKQAAKYLEQAANLVGLKGLAYQLVDIYLKLKDYKSALRVLNEAAQGDNDPKFKAQLMYTKANILRTLKRYGDERAALDEAVKLAPDNQLYLLALGDLDFQLAKYPEAVKVYEHALELKDDLDTRRRLAFAQAANNQLEDALKNFELVLPDAPAGSDDRVSILNALGNLYSRLDHPLDAAKAFIDAYQTKPGQSPMLLVQAATSYTVVKQWDKAASLFEQALKVPDIDPNLKYDVYEKLAVVMEQTSHPDEAAHYYELLLDHQQMDDARRLSLLRRLANVSELAKDYAAATRAYRGMIDSPLVEPKERRKLLGRLAVTAELAGEYDEAIKAYRQILSYNGLTVPERLDALKKMAVIANVAGEPQVAAEAYRLLLAGENLPLKDRIQAAASLAYVSKSPAEAEQTLGDLTKLLKDRSIQGKDRISLLRTVAVMADLAGHPEIVAQAYEKVVALMAPGDPERDKVLAQLAGAYDRIGKPEKAVPIYQDLLARLKLAKKDRIDMLRRLAISAQLAGKDAVSLDAFKQIIALGTDDWTVYQAYGIGLRAAGKCLRALRAFHIAQSLGADYKTDIYASFCYKDLDQPGLALHYLRLGLARGAAQMPLTQRYSLEAELGFLYSQTHQFKLAVKAWRAAVAISPDPILTLRLARAERLAGDIDAANEHLAKLVNVDLPPTLRADYYDEIAYLALLQGHKQTALAALDSAIALISTSDRLFRRGLLREQLGDLKGAIHDLEQAAQGNERLGGDGLNYTILAALGYAYNAAGRNLEAEHLLETVVRAQPDRLAPYTDLAYINKRALYNDQASRWFKLAIDNKPLYPIAPDRKLELDKKIFNFRRANQVLNKVWDFSAYTIMRTQLGNKAAFDPTGHSTLVSQGGMELDYRPDSWDWLDHMPLGYRNGKTFQIYGRTFWSYNNDSLTINRDSIQGGLGARWKPFADHTFYLAGERLFRIGRQARNDWLLRASYSWDEGYDISPIRDDWPFAQVYADAAYIPGRNWALYLTSEGMYGHSFKYKKQTVFTPHLFAGLFNTRTDTGSQTSFEAGPGIAVKYWFDGTKYQAYRSSAEGILQYRGGFDDSGKFTHGLVATLQVNF